ncbi:hypothetical protein MSAN_02498100 [Mycena sanguinolenta]|uniref:Uncharacterized protein n=1 Tax=Mycena sanguinolenta TaxID=230812 RepID=A0A8H6U1Q9_9AGAR|nr:hypothetical protein MSAN_02498100 [Mycena sanguinolenta]
MLPPPDESPPSQSEFPLPQKRGASQVEGKEVDRPVAKKNALRDGQSSSSSAAVQVLLTQSQSPELESPASPTAHEAAATPSSRPNVTSYSNTLEGSNVQDFCGCGESSAAGASLENEKLARR